MILGVLYLFIPAYVANMMPVIVKKIPFLNYPLDFGIKHDNKRLLGDNKTWRGFLFGVASSTVAFALQKYFYTIGFTRWAVIPYDQASITIGFLMGFGALLGDATESFIKRKIGYDPGKPCFPWDQIDFMIGALLFTVPLWINVWQSTLLAVIIIILGDVIVQKTAFLLKLKDDPL